ncbi:inactive leucine-rich repeat receptor-like protein kinase [Actinidia chinensis var. chinensis]|uniref:Inactive leucine-rich repeat receptor-like protein kinase n=1 Tax=Actinidia chinensis var. chinensis TaxID=1590841 RepID=A0A2R6R930_ACTCC|nr:inactive leucine-rich repeat receptor-like protein kinase [Actinidia chinensis var. chinensis]
MALILLEESIDDPDAFFIRGFVVGWSVAAVIAFAVTWFYMPNIFAEKVMKWKEKRRKKKKKKKKKMKKKKETSKPKMVQGSPNPTISDRIQDAKIHILEKYATRMSFSYLIRATENFRGDNIIGLGKQGTLYKAALGNGNFFAVKRFQYLQNMEQQFISEIMTIGRLKHRNLVQLFGFCLERKERLLVYNYVENGSLYDWLHPKEETKTFALEWPVRFRITIGIARGLTWLHHNCNSRIHHGNICSKCILLDKNFDPKISKFGEAVIVTSNYWNSYLKVYDKGESRLNDVFGFGILLLEVVTGEEPERVPGLSQIAHVLSISSLYDLIDRSLIGKGFDSEIAQILEVASECIQTCSSKRPTMLQVYKILTAIGARNGNARNIGTSEQIEEGLGFHNQMGEHGGIEIVEEIE